MRWLLVMRASIGVYISQTCSGEIWFDAGSEEMVGRERGWLCLFYVRIHGEAWDLAGEGNEGDLRILREDRAGSRADEGRKEGRSATRITQERHGASLVFAGLRSQYVYTSYFSAHYFQAHLLNQVQSGYSCFKTKHFYIFFIYIVRYIIELFVKKLIMIII